MVVEPAFTYFFTCYCYKDFYLKEEQTYWIKLCKIFLRRGSSCPSQGIFTPGGQAVQATVSYPHPFLFREKWLMVDIMNIQMTVQ